MKKKEKKDFAYYVLKAQSDNKMVFNTRNIKDPNIYKFFDKFEKIPQILKNIEVNDKNIINRPDIKKTIKSATKFIKGQGRILVRKSGTESKIRIMGESENRKLLMKCINMIQKKIK